MLRPFRYLLLIATVLCLMLSVIACNDDPSVNSMAKLESSGDSYMAQHNYDNAITAYKDALGNASKSYRVGLYYKLGMAYKVKGDQGNAMEAFINAMSNNVSSNQEQDAADKARAELHKLGIDTEVVTVTPSQQLLLSCLLASTRQEHPIVEGHIILLKAQAEAQP